MYLNKAIVIGNLTRDPELRALLAGIKVCSFSVATNRVWKDASGAKKEQSDFHNIVVFGRQAETVAQYMKKGSQVLVEGRMQTRSWEKDGEKKYRTEIVADRVQFGSKPTGTGAPYEKSSTESGSNMPKDDSGEIDYPEENLNLEDIPF